MVEERGESFPVVVCQEQAKIIIIIMIVGEVAKRQDGVKREQSWCS